MSHFTDRARETLKHTYDFISHKSDDAVDKLFDILMHQTNDKKDGVKDEKEDHRTDYHDFHGGWD